MKNKMSVIGGIAATALVSAGVGYLVKASQKKRKPLHKTAGQALKSVGAVIERMNF